MSIEQIVDSLGDHGCVVEPQAVAFLARLADPSAFIRDLVSSGRELPFHMTLDYLNSLAPAVEAITQAPRPAPAVLPAVPSLGRAPTTRAADHEAAVVLIKDAGGARATAGQIEDFVGLFADRFERASKLLRVRREVANAVPIKDARTHGRDVQLIGMVAAVKTSPNGHVFLELEDATDRITVLCHASRPDLVGETQTLLTDEVVGVLARKSKDGDLLLADQIVRPDVPMRAPSDRTDVPLAAAFLSDIHVGSRTFLPDKFARMLDWLKGEQGPARERQLARRVKYLVLAGDVVDGIGIFPGQDAELDIGEIHRQYEKLGSLLQSVPDHIHVVVQPGNHDAVRPTEPQPPFDAGIQEYFSGLDATFVSNPSTFSLHGVNVLSYHGFSMVDFATQVPQLRMDQPMPIMRQMLQSRHLAPTYGAATPLSPEELDYLLIEQIPDIFVTGHVHVSGIDQYRGITMINAGTWQDQTSYQRVHNLDPTPAKMPVVDLSDLRATQIDFSA